jgi:hypothetical protein
MAYVCREAGDRAGRAPSQRDTELAEKRTMCLRYKKANTESTRSEMAMNTWWIPERESLAKGEYIRCNRHSLEAGGYVM